MKRNRSIKERAFIENTYQPVKSADSADFADDVVAAAVVESPRKRIGEILWQTRSFSRRVSSTN